MTELLKEVFMQNTFASFKAAAVITLLFLLTKPITKKYTAGFRYYSWLAVMIIFLIPFGSIGISYQVNITPAVTHIREESRNIRQWYEKNTPEYTVTEEYNSHKHVNSAADGKAVYMPVVKTATAKKRVDITASFAYIWLIGMLGYFALHCLRYAHFKRSVKRMSSHITDDRILEIFEAEKCALYISRNIQLKLLSATDTPMLTGIIRPEIILPHTDYTDAELHLILRHELIHYERKDVLYQFVTLIFLSLHRFNPLVHLMARAIELDGETSCDEKTLENRAYDERIFYGEMLIKFLRTEIQKKSYLTTTFFGGKKGMKKRLTLIADKTTRRKGVTAMAAVMLAAVVASVSAAAMSSEYFDYVFEGNTSYLADFVKTEKKSVEDDRFKLTLEQYLVAENQAMIICSFEAKTDDAVEEMNAVDERGYSTFSGMDFLCFGPTDYDKAFIRSDSIGSLGREWFSNDNRGQFDTENKRYYVLKSDSITNEEKVDFYLSTDRIEGKPKIIIPMDYNLETKTVKFDDITVTYNPISISIKYPYSKTNVDCDNCEWNGRYFYFRMNNGEIKTFNQLYDYSGNDNDYDDEDNKISIKTLAWARSIIEPDAIKSIIVNDMEYPIDNPMQSKTIKIDENLKPFIINAYLKEHLWLPLREFCDGLGAGIQWDNDTQSASFSYRGLNYKITAGKSEITIDGTEYNPGDEAPFINEQGKLVVPTNFDCYKSNIDIHGCYMRDENDNLRSDARLHIIP